MPLWDSLIPIVLVRGIAPVDCQLPLKYGTGISREINPRPKILVHYCNVTYVCEHP